MSKYDNLFNKPTPINDKRPNSFLSNKDKEKEKDTKNYNYKDNEFPDLIPAAKTEQDATAASSVKKYSDIAATVNQVKKVQEAPIPPGWTGYFKDKETNKFIIQHGEKTKRQLEMDQEDKLNNNPSYIYNQMITTLANNWERYKTQYDSIHGEGAYDLVYYLPPIYPDDEYLLDEPLNTSPTFDEYEYEYSNDTE